MKYTTGLSASLAVLLTGLFTWGVSTDPDGWGGLVRSGERPDPGAVPLAAVDASSEVADALTYADVASGVAQPSVFHIAPPDAQAMDADFLAYLTSLKAAVEARDIEAVLEAADENILLPFAHGVGRESLRALLKSPTLAKDYWAAMDEVLSLPLGRTSTGIHCAPHFSCMALPPEAGIIDPFDTVFALSDNVPVYAAADEGAQELEILSFDAVRQLEPLKAPELGQPEWVKVDLGDGESGFVRAAEVRSFFDFRADFERSQSGWQMTAFIAAE